MTYLWDVRDLDAPTLNKTYVSTNTVPDHNMYIKGDLVFQSNYQVKKNSSQSFAETQSKRKESDPSELRLWQKKSVLHWACSIYPCGWPPGRSGATSPLGWRWCAILAYCASPTRKSNTATTRSFFWLSGKDKRHALFWSFL